ncbi:hypothetical protein DW083_19800 [Parabacteroides sp. AF48-14]|nr:hypothetical protein DW083_19800 [Parabacteroides sp. AF48-14]
MRIQVYRLGIINNKKNKYMEALNLEVKREVRNGRTQVGGIIAYYEQQIDVESGKMDILHVSFLKSDTKAVPLADGTTANEDQEIPLHVDIEYSANTFRCQILEQEGVSEYWDIFWQIFNQLKAE